VENIQALFVRKREPRRILIDSAYKLVSVSFELQEATLNTFAY
jgi:hypothetical protein